MRHELNAIERRILGALVEKGFTTPEQYPLTLNATAAACNQKSCRDPILELDEMEVLETLDHLRERRLVVRMRPTGSRTDRYRHCVQEQFEIDSKSAAVLAELLLRGPQTDGELRQRANRMLPIESIAEVQGILARLCDRSPALVVRLGPAGRKRGTRYAHDLYPPGEAPRGEAPRGEAPRGEDPSRERGGGIEDLRRAIDDLERRVARLEGERAPAPQGE